MQQILLNTTGTLTTIILDDLGTRTFTHPVSNVNLLNEFRLEEIRDSLSLQNFITAGHIIVTDQDSFVITDLKNDLGNAKIDFDTDRNNVVDNSERLNNQVGSYYLSRTNHTGQQSISSLSDLISGTAGYSINTENSWNLNNQNSTFYTNSSNINYDNSTTNLLSTNLQNVVTEVNKKVDELPYAIAIILG